MNKRTISPESALYKKTAPQPVVTGAKIQGVLLFRIVGDISKKEIAAAGTTYTLRCRDVAGNPIEASQTLTGIPGTDFVYPQIR